MSMTRFLFAVVLALALVRPAAAQVDQQTNKRAQTGMKFLSVTTDPRAAALGDAATALETFSSVALFSNPAAMARHEGFASVSLARTQWIAEIDYNRASLALSPAGGRYGTIGFSLVAVDYGELQETIRADNEAGFLDLGTFSPTALSVGVGYARALTDRFSVGAHVKYVYEDLGNSVMGLGQSEGTYERAANTLGVMAYDFGVLYKTGFRSLNFAVAARNFAPEIEFEEESFQLPLSLRIGVSMDVFDLTGASDVHALVVALDAEHPRDFAEQIKIGGEYTFRDLVSLRAGYTFPSDEQGVSLGLGVQQQLGGLGLGVDYAYTDFGVFNTFSRVHRLALQFSF